MREEKEFAKTVKADDAGVPVYLWNERVMLRGWTQERIDSILPSFRKLGWRMFMKGLRKDC